MDHRVVEIFKKLVSDSDPTPEQERWMLETVAGHVTPMSVSRRSGRTMMMLATVIYARERLSSPEDIVYVTHDATFAKGLTDLVKHHFPKLRLEIISVALPNQLNYRRPNWSTFVVEDHHLQEIRNRRYEEFCSRISRTIPANTPEAPDEVLSNIVKDWS